ncbi:acetylxylan esterase [Paenibacillus borealis]|uniref:acetylxylan esterase n=1 Tax=Paenibacillus borealis TaxID=160799 RepID=UPI00316ADB6E
MPLDKLKDYTGSTPKPEDFDRYLEEALEELRGGEPNVELFPAEFHSPVADCYHLYLFHRSARCKNSC